MEHDRKFEVLFEAMENKELPQSGIFFDGQVCDAYTFRASLIKRAKQSLILIDNYADHTVFTLFTKRKKGLRLTCYTKKISNALLPDVEKHNSQYPPIELKELKSSHDRFLIIGGKELYHFGASLKDLGKRWFAFSKMDDSASDILKKLKPATKDELITDN